MKKQAGESVSLIWEDVTQNFEVNQVEKLFSALKAIETLSSDAVKVYGLPPGQDLDRRNDMALACGPVWSAGPICLVTRWWPCSNLFVTYFFNGLK